MTRKVNLFAIWALAWISLFPTLMFSREGWEAIKDFQNARKGL